MASNLFSSVVSLGKAALDRLQGPTDPNAVKAVNPNDLVPVPAIDRDGCLILFGPRKSSRTDSGPLYEVVAHSEKNQSFSLFRSSDLNECRERFNVQKKVIPEVLSMDPDLGVLSSLQAMSDLLRSDPSLTVGHVAVELNFVNVVTNPQLDNNGLLDATDNEGRTPLMLAIKKQNIYLIRYLLSKHVSKTAVDKKGNTIFHYAATTTKDILTELISEEDMKPLNSWNEDGQTPLHIACNNDLPDCAKALLCGGADVNLTGSHDEVTPIHTAIESSSTRCVKEIIQMYPKQLYIQDIKYGGTPLHWAKSKEILEALLEAGCRIDAKNFQGDTALHVMTKHERLECVLALLCFGADINIKDSEGNTALHIGCNTGNVSIVRALLVFDADTSVTNNKGLTAWKIACEKTETGILNSFDFKDRRGVLFSLFAIGAMGSEVANRNDFTKEQTKNSPSHKRARCHFDELLGNAAKKPKSSSTEKKTRLLTIDGGGIKGLVLVRMLWSMEKIWNVPVIHCFDWICGTSTGAILALALAAGKSVAECQALYLKLKDKVFVDTKPYNSKPMEELLQQTFGHLKMYDIQHPKVVVTATMADRIPPDLQLFRSYKSPQELLGINDFENPELPNPCSCQPSEQLVWKAARASGAAPSFFRPEGNFVDGGIMANNPTIDLLTEITEFNVAQRAIGHDDEVVKPTVLLSIGTGVPPLKKATVVDIFRPDSAHDTLKLIMNWDGMGKLMLERVLNTDGRVVDQSRSWCLANGVPFFRLSPNFTVDVELDEKDEKVLVDMMWTAMAYIHSKRDDILQLQSLLCT